MTSHRTTMGPSRFRLIEQRSLRFTTLRRDAHERITAGDLLLIAETVPDGSRPTGWLMECLITDVSSALTMPGLFDRDVVALSLEVLEIYEGEVEIVAEPTLTAAAL